MKARKPRVPQTPCAACRADCHDCEHAVTAEGAARLRVGEDALVCFDCERRSRGEKP